MTVLARDRQRVVARPVGPAVVEHADSLRSSADGRTTGSSAADRREHGLRSQLVRFAAIGVVSTLAWAGLYSLLRGAGLGSVAANAIALIVTVFGNTAANRRLTFGVTGRPGLARDHGAGLVAFGLAIGLTTAAATLLDRVGPGAPRLVELVVLSLANVAATGGRFVLLRTWVGRATPVRAT